MRVANYDKATQKIIQFANSEELKEKGKGEKRVRKNWGILQLDATVADQYIKYPTDLDLLNDSREWSEELIDNIYLTKKNRKWLEEREIQITNKPLGRPKKETPYEKSKKKKLKNKRNQIEGKSGEEKNEVPIKKDPSNCQLLT
jgi:hypothetical protein